MLLFGIFIRKLSLGAGVDHLFDKEKLPNVPIVRLKDDIMAQRMSNYVKAQILNYQLKLYHLRNFVLNELGGSLNLYHFH